MWTGSFSTWCHNCRNPHQGNREHGGVSHIQSQSLHWRLSGEVPAIMYCPRVVWKVGATNIIMVYTNNMFYRCTAKDTDLEAKKGVAFCHWEFSEAFVEEFSVAKLWDKWRLVGDVIASLHYYFFCNTDIQFCSCLWTTFLGQTFIEWSHLISFIKLLRECSKTISWHGQLHLCYELGKWGYPYPWWIGSLVNMLNWLINLPYNINDTVLWLLPPFHVFTAFLRDMNSNNGWGMIQKPWWKFSCLLL